MTLIVHQFGFLSNIIIQLFYNYVNIFIVILAVVLELINVNQVFDWAKILSLTYLINLP